MKVVTIVAFVLATGALAGAGDTFSLLDADHDGTIDEPEAQAAGRAVFQRLDINQDKRLETAEIGGRLGTAVLKAADPGADSALNAEEYAALVTARFKSANADADGKVDPAELKTLTGASFG